MTNDRLYKNYFYYIYKYIDKKVIFISVISNQSYIESYIKTDIALS